MAFKKGHKATVIEGAKQAAVLETVKSLSAEKLVQEIGAKSLSIQQGMADLMAQMQSEITKLRDIEAAIQFKKAELKSLHDIEAAAITLDQLQADIETKKKDWENEQTTYNAQQEQARSDRENTWEREEAEHQYAMKQRNKQADDAHSALVAQNKRNEDIRTQELSRSWIVREEAIKAKETAITQMEQRIAGLDTEIKTKVDREVNIIGGAIKRDYEHKMELATMQANAAASIDKATISSLNHTITQKDETITALSKQVESANTRAEQIAKSAVEASSGRQALQAVQQQAETLATPGSGKGR